MPEVVFHGNLAELVPCRAKTPPRRAFPRAVKDLLETLGIPHTEIGKIMINSRESDPFSPVNFEDRVEVFPHTLPRPSPWGQTGLPSSVTGIAFFADNNVAGAGKLLRLIGFDTAMEPGLNDKGIAERANEEKRVVLSRDRNLLKRRLVLFGCLVRSNVPWKQAAEIVLQYDLARFSAPFSRCVPCNTLLVPVGKEKVMDRLPPMTRLHYDSFNICPSCGRIYWRGSHIDRILARLEPILGNYQASE
jgi:uncharacterized protein with PIN domain